MTTEGLLALSREAHWSFPSSFGNPIRPGDSTEELVPDRGSFAEAARALVAAGQGDAAAELAANVWRLWMAAGDVGGGRAFLASVLDAGEGRPSRARALALYGDGLLALRQGAVEDSRARNEEALAAAQESGDPEALALAHLGLSRVAFEVGDCEHARSLAMQAREHARPLDPALRGQGPLHLHAQSTRLLGEYDEASELFTESLEMNRRIGDSGMVVVELHNLGHVELHRGNVEAAERHFAECAQLGASDDPYGAAMTDLNKAAVLFARGDHEQAAELLSRAESTLADAGIAAAGDDQFELDWLREQLAEES